ncbi:hypothetical protein [Myxosarcina sp. GI1]|uniref:hypothetical protein n=1 Tax=Myxosarcina sp. GI1 TaxID=1541065 RepID=UPI0012E035D0|nr:hypothetical protein [Myxosarcina sp. GI1]
MVVLTDRTEQAAIAQCFHKVRYTYLHIVEQYRKKTYNGKTRTVKSKKPDFGSKTQNTFYIERFNLTLRQKISYLQDPVLDELQNRTGLFVNVTERATGNGGDIFIKTS